MSSAARARALAATGMSGIRFHDRRYARSPLEAGASLREMMERMCRARQPSHATTGGAPEQLRSEQLRSEQDSNPPAYG